MRALRFSVQAHDVRVGDIIELLDPEQAIDDSSIRTHVTSVSTSEYETKLWLDRETDEFGQPLNDQGYPDTYGWDIELRSTDYVIVLRSV